MPWVHIQAPFGIEDGLEAVEGSQRSQLMVLRLETLAQIYRLLADSASQAAQIHAQADSD